MRNAIRFSAAAACGFVAACSSQDSTSSVSSGNSQQPNSATLSVGATAAVSANGTVTLASGSAGGEYLFVVTDTALNGRSTADAFRVAGTNIAVPGTVSAPSTSIAPLGGAIRSAALTPDYNFSLRLNQRAERTLRARIPGARLAYSRRATLDRSASSAQVQVGDILTLNVSGDPCDTIAPHAARVVAIGSTAIIVADTLNPAGGFTTADYQRFVARFDTLVYPIDVANFGAPVALGPEGKILLFFTTAVNALTPKNSTSYVGGFFFERDQFPVLSTPELEGCPGSNARNIFYLLTPDPLGTINGNVRSTGFVDSITTAILAHEFQHLINTSRRLYVNAAQQASDEVWLNEGLSHVAEELLFYHEGRSAPKQNIDATALRNSTALRDAFNADESPNAARYREYLIAPSISSPIRNDDSLSTRGATWDLLRYLADRKTRTSGTDAAVWQALVNSKTAGVPNLRNVFGANVGDMIRDWSISQYTDDYVPNVSADLTQPSWNWRNIFPALGGGGNVYPLVVTPLSGSAGGSVIPGGSTFYRFAVPANANATITLSASSSMVQGTVVRLR